MWRAMFPTVVSPENKKATFKMNNEGLPFRLNVQQSLGFPCQQALWTWCTLLLFSLPKLAQAALLCHSRRIAEEIMAFG